MSSCKEGWIIWPVLEVSEGGAAGLLLLPHALHSSLRPRLSLPPSFPLSVRHPILRDLS